MVDIVAMKDLITIVNSLSKLSKDCVMRIVTNKIYFIISDENRGPQKPSLWCELPVGFYFKEYTLNGLSEERNEIYLSFTCAMFVQALGPLKHNANQLKLKLTNKEIPCLTFEIEQATHNSFPNCQLVHDIPVKIIAHKYWKDYMEPSFNDFHVSLQMPNLKLLKTILERLKNLSSSLIVSANKFGRLTLHIKTTSVALSAHFTNLNVESFAVDFNSAMSEGEETGISNCEDTVSATVDIRKFLMFLSGMQLTNYNTTCSIVNHKLVRLSLEQPGALSLQCYFSQICT